MQFVQPGSQVVDTLPAFHSTMTWRHAAQRLRCVCQAILQLARQRGESAAREGAKLAQGAIHRRLSLHLRHKIGERGGCRTIVANRVRHQAPAPPAYRTLTV